MLILMGREPSARDLNSDVLTGVGVSDWLELLELAGELAAPSRSVMMPTPVANLAKWSL
jgi:hypothetical protein